MVSKSLLALPLVVAFLFTACGGSGGSNQEPSGSSAPSISSIDPSVEAAGSPDTPLTVNGSNFSSSAVINWNGTALTTKFVNSGELTAVIPAEDLAVGSYAEISVTDGGITTGSKKLEVTNPRPIVTSISPDRISSGSSSITLTVNGSKFVASSQIQWNSSVLSTTVLSTTRMTTQIPADSLSSIGSATVSVVSPGPGGGTSNVTSFSIIDTTTHYLAVDYIANDLAWDSVHGKLYASLPSSNGSVG
ncbi:MAG TPA: hypothetical protein VGL89_19275, partial [Candidatus Koribacter sp.]